MSEWKDRSNKDTMGKMVLLDRFNDYEFGMVISDKWHYWDGNRDTWARVGAEQFLWCFLPKRGMA